MNERRRYRILAPIARGSFGTVYRAELLGQGGFTKQVALKVLNPGLAENDEFTRRLRDEARLLALIRHRSIVAVDGLVELEGHWTIVMEYIEGADLKTLLCLGPVPPAAALEITAEIAAALHTTWNRRGPDGRPLRVLHRDLKPSNIRITPAGEVKVLDFGVARADFDSRESETRNLHFGSAAYMSPERIDFVDGPEGDIYAVGSMLYEMLAGEPLGKTTPDPSRHTRRLNEALTRLWSTRHGQGATALGPLLLSTLAYEASERPRARDLERRCTDLSRKAPAMGLRDWAEQAVNQSMPQALISGQGETFFGGQLIAEAPNSHSAARAIETPAPEVQQDPTPATAQTPTPGATDSAPPLRPIPELPDDEDSGDEDTDQGLNSGWGARAHLKLPEISNSLFRASASSAATEEEATQVRIAPPVDDPSPAAGPGETVGLVADQDLLTGFHEAPSERLAFVNRTQDPPEGHQTRNISAAVPRGRNAAPLVREQKEPVQDDGSGWVFGTLALAAIGFLVATYMPSDPPGSVSETTPEARPGDLPGQAWNPENDTLRGLEATVPAPASGDPSKTPAGPQRGNATSTAGPETVEPASLVTDPGSGTVRVTGYATQVTLIGEGRRLPPGEVPPGAYRIEASFQEGSTTKAGRIQVTDGSQITLHCSKVYKTCRVE